jgi:ATP-dependent Clp protease protease subunit
MDYSPQSRYILPRYIERTPQGVREYDPYAKLFEERIIFLGVQIDDASADDVMAQLLVLESLDPDRDIQMYINSPGGSYTAMTAIYDTMQFVKCDVQTVCLDIEIQANEILRMRDEMEGIFSHHTGRSVEDIRLDMDRDKILTAPQAKEYGIIDQVLTTRVPLNK